MSHLLSILSKFIASVAVVSSVRLPRNWWPFDTLTWLFVSILWSLCGTASLVTPWGHPFLLTPFYRELAEISGNAALWGIMLLLYAVTGTIILLIGSPLAWACFGMAGTILWGFFSITLLVASLPTGVPSWGGLFDLLLAAGCLFASIKAMTPAQARDGA